MRKDSLAPDPFDDRITAALERQPRLVIPPDFAARVAARAPRPLPASVSTPVIARRVAFAALCALLLAITLLAPAATGPVHFLTTLEWSLCAEFLAIAAWLLLTPRPSA
jgi:hypothetical protein